ncbi:MAG: hypothetical protein AAB787_01610 [Patescibacteria group bacterium]
MDEILKRPFSLKSVEKLLEEVENFNQIRLIYGHITEQLLARRKLEEVKRACSLLKK